MRSGVDTRPFNSAYKVYIIDEVHMLTKEAFNALLKTLEEPPSHVLFILATTEKHKILDTIISRCQVFDFKRATIENSIELIRRVCDKEGRNIDEESADFVASLGDGSFRDTLSHLQKVFAYISGDISFEKVSEVMNVSDPELLQQFIRGVNNMNQEVVFTTYSKIIQNGVSIQSFGKAVLGVVRNILLVRYSLVHKKHIESIVGKEIVSLYDTYDGITSRHLQDLIDVVGRFESTNNPEALFEVYLFNLFAE